MVYNKNNYENNRLTSKQEKFVYAIMNGKTQRQAMLEAYPTRKNWTDESLDVAACNLMKNNKVKLRLDELKKIEEDNIKWTRKRALNEINYIIDVNKKDIERQQQGYDEELAIKQQELKEWVNLLTVPNIDKEGVQKQVKSLITEISYLKQRRRVSAVNTNGILNAARILNRMQGYDVTKVEIKEEDDSRSKLKALSVEELKALAYSNKKKEE